MIKHKKWIGKIGRIKNNDASRYKKVCVITGCRADYGILKKLIGKIRQHPKLKLQLIATGTHLSKKYG